MSSENSEKSWEEIPPAGVTWKKSLEYLTKGWRTFKPVIDHEKCIKCMRCYYFCPDSCVIWDGNEINFNYDFCKGCGVCAKECPVNAIDMVKEEK
ncbi:MAG: 4Fe-4S binding protein [Candidatus Odinarchaeia archaeon]